MFIAKRLRSSARSGREVGEEGRSEEGEREGGTYNCALLCRYTSPQEASEYKEIEAKVLDETQVLLVRMRELSLFGCPTPSLPLPLTHLCNRSTTVTTPSPNHTGIPITNAVLYPSPRTP